jgi:plasmid stabilization system protein ParE
MKGYVLAPEAATDLFQIWQYLRVEASRQVADRVEALIRNTIALLAKNPGIGHFRRDLTDEPVKFYAVYSWLVVYRPKTEPLQVISVLHAGRDVSKILTGRIG